VSDEKTETSAHVTGITMFSIADSTLNNDILIPLENLWELRFTGLGEIIILNRIFFKFAVIFKCKWCYKTT